MLSYNEIRYVWHIIVKLCFYYNNRLFYNNIQ